MDLPVLANYAVFMAILSRHLCAARLGLNIQWGFTGLFNAGIANLFAIGGVFGHPHQPAGERAAGGYELPLVVGWLASMVAAAAIAWPIGKIRLRFRSDYFRHRHHRHPPVIRNRSRLFTGGVRGVTGIPRPFWRSRLHALAGGLPGDRGHPGADRLSARRAPGEGAVGGG